MSFELNSFEKIAQLASEFYFPDLTETYDRGIYCTIIFHLVNKIAPDTINQIMTTRVILPEIIWLQKKTLLLSEPLLIKLLNKPIKIQKAYTEYIDNFDIFNFSKIKCKKANNDNLFDVLESSSKVINQKRPVYSSAKVLKWCTKRIVERNKLGIHQMQQYSSELSEHETVCMIQLIRLICVVRHWFQHYCNDNDFMNHQNFSKLQFSDIKLQDKYLKNRKRTYYSSDDNSTINENKNNDIEDDEDNYDNDDDDDDDYDENKTTNRSKNKKPIKRQSVKRKLQYY